MIAPLDCAACTGLCCRTLPVPIGREDRERIEAGVTNLPEVWNECHDPSDRIVEKALRGEPILGGFYLARRADGACVFLSDRDRCSVYEYRPVACRQFTAADCQEVLDG